MSALARVGQIPADVRAAIDRAVFRLARRAILAVSSSSGDDQAEGYQVAAPDPQGQAPARRFQHYGFSSNVPVRSEIITLLLHGVSSNRVHIASKTPGAGPADQKEGEVELFTIWGHRVALLESGEIRFTDADGSEMTWRSGRLARARDVYTGGTPVAAPSSGDLTAVASGKDSFFEVLLTVVNAIVPGANLAVVTFTTPWPATPLAVAAMRTGGKHIAWDVNQATLTLKAAEALAPGVYVVAVHVGGV